MEAFLVIVICFGFLVVISPLIYLFVGRDWRDTFSGILIITLCFGVYYMESFIFLSVVLLILLIKARRR